MALPLDKLNRALRSLQQVITSNPPTGTLTRKPTDQNARIKAEIQRVKATFLSTDLSSSESRGIVSKIMQIFIGFLHHTDENLRSLAYETFLSLCRHLILIGHDTRLLLIIISELGEQPQARPAAGLLTTLTKIVRLTKPKRLELFSTHILNAVEELLNRPEEAVHLALISNIPTLFKTIGPVVKNLALTRKDLSLPFEQRSHALKMLNSLLSKCLDVRGSANRSSVLTILQLSTYSPLCLQRALSFCTSTLSSLDDQSNPIRLTASINILKGLFDIIMKDEKLRDGIDVRKLVCLLLCFTHSSVNEVLIASFECLAVVFPLLTRDQLSFYPPDVILSQEGPSTEIASLSINNSPFLPRRLLQQKESIQSDPSSLNSSLVDIPSRVGPPSEFDQLSIITTDSSMNGNEGAASPSNSWDSRETNEEDNSEIIDPLMHSELYEEELSRRVEEEIPPMSPKSSSNVLQVLPDIFRTDPRKSVIGLSEYTLFFISYRFLLQEESQGLISDQKVRVSHKMLAFSLITLCAAKTSKVLTIGAPSGGKHQNLHSLTGFIYHSDDKLAAAAINFIATAQSSAGDTAVEKDCRDWFGFVWSRLAGKNLAPTRRALLQSITGRQRMMERIDLVGKAITLATTSKNINFGHLKTAMASFLCSLDWSRLSSPLRSSHQMSSLDCLIDLLAEKDPNVVATVAHQLPLFVERADFGCRTDHFMLGLPDSPLTAFPDVPMVVSLPDTICLSSRSNTKSVTNTLLIVIRRLLERLSSYRDAGLSEPYTLDQLPGLISALSSLSIAFPPSLYHNPWSSVSVHSHGLISLLVDIADASAHSPAFLAKILRLQAAIMGGHFSNLISDIVNDKKSAKEREANPPMGDTVLFEKMFLMPMRVLNLYYCIAEDRRLELSGRLALTMGSKPVKELRGTERISSYSRLINSGLLPTKSTAFNDCPSLLAIVPQLRGSFRNYLDSVDEEHEAKMVELLDGAVCLLSTLFEMMTLSAVRPLVPELTVYIESLTPFSPLSMTRLSTQILKAIFGRNTQTVNLGHLKSIRVYKREEVKSECEVAEYLFCTELQSFRSRVTTRSAVDNSYLEHFGWLASASTVVSPPVTIEVNTAIRYFESFITKIVAMYGSTTDVETKKAMLNLFIQLRLSGIEFDLVDPTKTVVGSVEEQLGHLVYPEMIREVISFLTVLARYGSLKWSVLKLHALALCNALEESKWKDQILDGLEVFLHEFLLYRKETPFEVTSLLFSPPFASFLLVHCPAKYLQLYHMYLYTKENNEESFRATSCNIFKQLATNFNRSRLSIDWTDQKDASLLSSLFLVVGTIPPSSLLPVDDFVTLLKSIVLHSTSGTDKEDNRASDLVIAICPLLFMICSDIIEEDRIIHRTESYFEKDTVTKAGFIFRPLARALKFTLESMRDDRPEDLANENLAVIRAASIILRLLAVSNHPIFLENFIISSHEEGLLDPSLITLCDRLTPEWMELLSRFKDNDRVANLFVDTLLHTQNRVNHRYLHGISLQIFVRFVARHRYPGSSTLTELKEKVLLSEESNIQIEVMKAMKQTVEVEEEFVKAIPPEMGERFINLALKSIDKSHLRSQKSALVGEFVQSYERNHGKGSISIARPKMRRRHTRLADNPSDLLKADTPYEVLICTLSKCSRFPSILVPSILEMEEKEMSKLCLHMFRKGDFSLFIATVLGTTRRLITSAGADRSAISRLQLATSTFLKCVINVEELTSDQLLTLFANVNPLIVLRVETSILDEYVEQSEKMVEIATGRLKRKYLVDETCSALHFFLQHPTTTHTFAQNPMANLNLIHSLLNHMLELVEARSGIEYPSRERSEIFSVFGVDIESKENDQLFDLFHMSQFILSLFSRNLLPSSDPLGLSLRSLLRLPIINSFALIPKTALDGGWHPSLELVNKSISVPLPPIHKLNDLDVLDDFTWRCLFLGWTSRQQFESVWVSLVGVLSSTPSGDELNSEMALDAVLVSSLAIRRLTSFLLLTQLEPQPGNPIGGRFRLPSRDISTTFSDSEYYSRLCQLLGDLTNDAQPETILKRSIEWSIGSKRNRQVFHLDQFGISDLWAHVGLVNDKSPNLPAPLRATTTYFLDQLRIELDAASAVRSLYENFSHWFSRGIDVMPMELLSETLRAMCLLCDLFEDPASFESLDLDMRMLSNCSYLTQGDELGLVLLTHSKAVAVIGQEEFSDDQWRKMQSLISAGLDHRRSGVRCSTIRGVLFLLQSSTAEILIDLVKSLVDWTIRELDKGTSQMTDLVFNNGDHTSIEYRSLLWSLAFRLIEHPSRIQAKSRLFQIVIDVFLSSSPSTMWQMEALTIGMQELVVHSQTFAAPVIRTAINCLDKFSSHPTRLPFALRLLSIAVHRESALIGDFTNLLPSLMETSRMCETNELSMIVRTAIALKNIGENPLEILRWLSSLIFTPSSRPHPQPQPMISALHSLTQSIRDTRIEAGLLDLSRDLLASSQSRQRAVVLSLTLAASSPFTQFVHLYESLRLFHSSTSQSSWELFLQHYRDIIST
ncbi:hypothetical protein PRIPAC_97156 [Pristionchus pacificus]|nr:hypothetical protein PRIPAC_97156 [Pristionchus pacificus]